MQYGFICGSGGAWYSETLQLLNAGDRVWVKVSGSGFVGVCRVTGRAQPAAIFKVTTPASEVLVLEGAEAATTTASSSRSAANSSCPLDGWSLYQWCRR